MRKEGRGFKLKVPKNNTVMRLMGELLVVVTIGLLAPGGKLHAYDDKAGKTLRSW
jgi:hypothetical protein